MKVKIYKPAESAMQSGDANVKRWVLEFEQKEKTRFINSLIGWVGNSDMNQELRLKFDSKESAIKYAEKQGLEYEVFEPKQRKLIIQSYADNFK